MRVAEESEIGEGDSRQRLRLDSGPKMEIVAIQATVNLCGVLTRDNYERWKILMQHCLICQNLWHIVESTKGNMSDDRWLRENAFVLLTIKASCGEEIFYQIKDENSAKDVWDTLEKMHKPRVVSQLQTGTFTPQTFGNLVNSQYETLTNAISNGDLSLVKTFFRENPNARSARIFGNGYTALHFSVYKRKKEIVDYLINSTSVAELKISDRSGSTALSIAARFGVGKSIAKKLVGRNRELLTIADSNGKFPVQLACSTIHEDMARYLYVETPLRSLDRDSRFYILQDCISRKMFGKDS
ncbi:hypothetical protein SLEP1_g46713 [Rubroshorea leprosula]|uniref:DUF4219 domain-containing protein n=2 Tax=Rubroshorea leprosula TaxID=152421 RepID=A0AAV5LN60_9ROSI|nr:hypothetical protein SLEP1_g46713 [Rubroshorea leprosula]